MTTLKRTKTADGLLIIESTTNGSLFDIPREDIGANLDEFGAIMFRNFNTDSEVFSKFISKISARITLDPARSFVSKGTQLVDAGVDKVGLHLENGNAPVLPDLIWFMCEIAAKSGSQSTYCDGRKVWANMDEDIKEKFEAQRIKYSRNIPEKLWKKYVFHEIGGMNSVDNVTVDHLLELGKRNPGQYFSINNDGSVFSELKTWAVHPTQFSELPSFANSMLGPSYNYEKPKICFEDGSEIGDDIWVHIEKITDRYTYNIPWENGDVVLIDNTRVMHGRRRIEDPNRRICAALSYWN